MTTDDKTIYKVVVNHEEQYSIWFADRDLPAGWKEAGKEGAEGGMSRLHRAGLEGHAPAQPQKTDGQSRVTP